MVSNMNTNLKRFRNLVTPFFSPVISMSSKLWQRGSWGGLGWTGEKSEVQRQISLVEQHASAHLTVSATFHRHWQARMQQCEVASRNHAGCTPVAEWRKHLVQLRQSAEGKLDVSFDYWQTAQCCNWKNKKEFIEAGTHSSPFALSIWSCLCYLESLWRLWSRDGFHMPSWSCRAHVMISHWNFGEHLRCECGELSWGRIPPHADMIRRTCVGKPLCMS